MVKALNRLEALGWAWLAADKLSVPAGQARMLQLLAVQRPGFVVSYDDLSAVLTRNPQDRPKTAASLRVATKVCQLKNALIDVGMPARYLECVFRRGYRLDPAGAAFVRDLIEARL